MSFFTRFICFENILIISNLHFFKLIFSLFYYLLMSFFMFLKHYFPFPSWLNAIVKSVECMILVKDVVENGEVKKMSYISYHIILWIAEIANYIFNWISYTILISFRASWSRWNCWYNYRCGCNCRCISCHRILLLLCSSETETSSTSLW